MQRGFRSMRAGAAANIPITGRASLWPMCTSISISAAGTCGNMSSGWKPGQLPRSRTYGISGERREGRPGIWVKRPGRGDAKIAAIGVRVRRWVTYHGIAVNVCPDLSHFSGIVPCGIADAGVTSIEAECQ